MKVSKGVNSKHESLCVFKSEKGNGVHTLKENTVWKVVMIKKSFRNMIHTTNI